MTPREEWYCECRGPGPGATLRPARWEACPACGVQAPWRLPVSLERHSSSERFHAILREQGALHDRKQEDYGQAEDPFANVRGSQEWHVRCESCGHANRVPAWLGAMIRATDKVRRLQAFSRRGELSNESVLDAFDDLSVYSSIARVLYEEEVSQTDGGAGNAPVPARSAVEPTPAPARPSVAPIPPNERED
jgi:hypothetical protein